MSEALKIVQKDLVGDCYRLNRSFQLMQDQITALKSSIGSSTAVSSAPQVFADSHANRATVSPDGKIGSLYIETDRGNVMYQSQLVSGVASWRYISGRYPRTQSQLAALAATLGAEDTGFLVFVSDFAHELEWTGTAWQWGPNDSRDAGLGAFFYSAPVGLVGWKAIDGTGDDGSAIGASHPVKILKPDGTTDSITTMLALSGYMKAGTFTGGVGLASAPIVTISATGTTTTAASGGGVAVPTAAHVHTASVLMVSDPIDHMEFYPFIRK